MTENGVNYCVEYPDGSEKIAHNWALSIHVGSHVLYETQTSGITKEISQLIDSYGAGVHGYLIYTQHVDEVEAEPSEISFNAP